MARPSQEKLTQATVVLSKEEKDKPRRFRMVAYTGVQFSRMWGQMMIDLKGIDLDGGKLPMLLDHQALPCAVADKRCIDKDEGLILEGYFLDTEHAKHVQRLADQGSPGRRRLASNAFTRPKSRKAQNSKSMGRR
jgi:hypothetical protein